MGDLMSATRRTVRVYSPEAGRRLEQQATEAPGSWRADRNERLRKTQIDAKRIARSDEFTARRESERQWHIGSAVRAVA
jgi:hypothetical protein